MILVVGPAIRIQQIVVIQIGIAVERGTGFIVRVRRRIYTQPNCMHIQSSVESEGNSSNRPPLSEFTENTSREEGNPPRCSRPEIPSPLPLDPILSRERLGNPASSPFPAGCDELRVQLLIVGYGWRGVE